MKFGFAFFLILFTSITSYSQTPTKDYTLFSNRADSLFVSGDYANALILYNKAFAANADVAKVVHRYKAASCYSQLKMADSAFIQLNRIAEKGRFSQVDLITNDYNFKNLFSDPRWNKLIDKIKQNNKVGN